MIRHQRDAGDDDDGGVAAFGDPLRVAAERADMGGIADKADARAEFLREIDRLRGPAHHADRSRGAVAFELEGGGQKLVQDRLAGGLVGAGLDLLQVDRDADHAVGIDAARVGPDQDLGDGPRVGGRHAVCGKDGGCEPQQFVAADMQVAHVKSLMKCIPRAGGIIIPKKDARIPRRAGANSRHLICFI